MKTKTISLIICFLTCIPLLAQDIIITKDGKKMEVTVTKVTRNNIQYLIYKDPNKVVFTIDKVLIKSVEFAYGKKDLSLKNPEQNSLYFIEDKVSNFLLNFSAFTGNTLAFAYEKGIKMGQTIMTEIKIYGIGSASMYEEEKNGIGIDFHYRLKTQSFFKNKEYRPKHLLHGPYFAPMIGFSTGTIKEKNFYNDSYNSSKHTGIHLGLQYGNQWIIQRKISVDASFGYHYFFGSISGNKEYKTLKLGNMVGNNKLFSFNLRVGFLTGKNTYNQQTKPKHIAFAPL